MGKRLVRDRALENWRVSGAEHRVRPVQDAEEHVGLLRQKLLEEATELAFASGRAEVLKESADVVTVMMALGKLAGVHWAEVLDAVVQRNAESGSFMNGMVWETDR